MKEAITIDREVGAILLQRTPFLGVFVLVEGSTDKIFYQRFFHENCKFIVPNGKPSNKLRVIEIIEELGKKDVKGVIGVIDADFDRLIEPSIKKQNIVMTDTHDLESLIFSSSALEKVISEVCSPEKVVTFSQNRDIRTTILEVAVAIGYLRWLSIINGLHFSFDNIELSKFLDAEFKVDDEKLIVELKNKSSKHSINNEDLLHVLIQLKSNLHDPWQVCCGHDLVKVFGYSLRKLLGSQNKNDNTTLSTIFRVAYESSYFLRTQMFIELQVWEAMNPAHKVIREDF